MEYNSVPSTRRWQRFQIDLPVRIAALNGTRIAPILARGTDISRAGMALRCAIGVKAGDMMQLQFPTSTPCRVSAVVRNRVGNRLGLEFLTQLPPDEEAIDPSKLLSNSALSGSHTPIRRNIPCNPQLLYARLRQKQQEREHLELEIEALQLAIPLLAENDEECSRRAAHSDPRSQNPKLAWPTRP